MTNALLEARRLVFCYGGVDAVRGIDLQLNSGECLGLLGPNGAGKTTTLEMLEGIRPPTSGQVLYQGGPLDDPFRQQAGIMFQSTALPDHLRVRDVLELFGRLYPSHRPIAELSRELGLEGLLERNTKHLSGGQRQRLLLAVALIHGPRLLFLDEPTTGLDPQARRDFWNLIQNIQQTGTSILLTTHYMDEAYALCDRVAIMDHGRIIAEGAPKALLERYFSDVILQLPRSVVPEDFHIPGMALVECGELLEIIAPDVNQAIAALLSRGVSLERLRIRARTLDDLFLHLTTGKKARPC
jgi:ABC-2 type transport system ATP-binding protein